MFSTTTGNTGVFFEVEASERTEFRQVPPPPKTPNSLTEYHLAAPASYCPCVLSTKVGVAVGSYTYNLSKNMLFPKASTLSAFVEVTFARWRVSI